MYYDCDGNCVNDEDGDEVCDEFEILGCTLSDACNYDSLATDENNISCTYACYGCMDPEACNYDATASINENCAFAEFGYDCNGDCISDSDGNGICDPFELIGCMNTLACNYEPGAIFDDGSCEFLSCIVFDCSDINACNYNADTDYDDGSCEYAEYPYDCNGECEEDNDADGICDIFEIFGCQDSEACNYSPDATDDLDSCTYDCSGCIDPAACNFLATATQDDGNCDYVSCIGCTDSDACNYDPTAIFNDGTCNYLDECGVCNGPGAVFECGCADIPEGDCDCDGSQLDAVGICGGDCEEDVDGNGVCDDAEVLGCMDFEACNYDPTATISEGCYLPEFGYDCDGDCLSDSDEDGVCDPFEVLGCTLIDACNYDESATENDGTCLFSPENLDCDGNCINDADNDGTCDELENPIELIIPENATVECNDEAYEGVASATEGCTVPVITYIDYVFLGACPNTSTIFRVYTATDLCGNFATDIQQIDIVDTTAPTLNIPEDYSVDCEYDIILDEATVTDNCSSEISIEVSSTEESGDVDGSYILRRTFTATDDCDNTAIEIQTITVNEDGNSICGDSGCTDICACNYNAEAVSEDDSCIYDGCEGCTYSTAVNYNSSASFEDGTCLFEGCIDSEFSNYNPFANDQGLDICSNSPGNADFNGDGIVQLQDLLELIISFGTSAPTYGGIVWVQEVCLIEPYTDEILLEGAGFEVGDEAAACYPGEGCMYPLALNYNEEATSDGGFCVFPGCINADALNFNSIANLENGTCKFSPCPDLNGDGIIQLQDLLNFLLVWGTEY
jgi:hypothetical protein